MGLCGHLTKKEQGRLQRGRRKADFRGRKETFLRHHHPLPSINLLKFKRLSLFFFGPFTPCRDCTLISYLVGHDALWRHVIQPCRQRLALSLDLPPTICAAWPHCPNSRLGCSHHDWFWGGGLIRLGLHLLVELHGAAASLPPHFDPEPSRGVNKG